MYTTNVTDDFNDTLSININCTNNDNNDNNIEIIIPLFTIIPCGLSIFCLISLMTYTLIKPLFNIKGSNTITISILIIFYTQIIQFAVL